ncbi:MAG: PRC-barrel domain-containing protein [Anaerolineae bacterium]|nr:PRC-barrel domain-containing protein [Anaerolineae bacterium]MCB9129915.1 PRC-barrel domain-containing protein [Anaerolineales bacterium]MCB0244666.1 PRC-barrel domain-containing protein [Anaerolineae bacterium]MCB9140856.1 PRC-barrel domain-containing protein [Anaerolineales bacterium]MCO5246259.1 PRC-barrel domain-containing protein [Anaerolineae bacterium]
MARDGRAGKVDEFVIDAQTGVITHLVVRETHWWRHKEIVVPVSEISEIEEDEVILKLDRRELENLAPVEATAG